IAGQAAIGAWKHSYMTNKPASFLLVAFAGAPLTQTIYGFILMSRMLASTVDPFFVIAAGIAGGLAIGMSAYAQGKAAAAGCDAFTETGKGYSNYLIVVGLCETIALFVLAFLFGAV
ncbi:MAG: V-type ATP synthase subunit K, partial [Spirochaetales bacterium]|nr:V-type ATP synthase subunit K [Spirochaetales bacterium]